MTAHAAIAPSGYSRLRINRIGLWLFILSETFLFAAMISARYYLLGLERPHELNQALGLGISLILLVSSLSAFMAERSIGQGNRAAMQRYLLITVGLGVLFVAGVAFEWTEAFVHFPTSTAFGTVFFSLTGLHAAHVVSGMIVLLLVSLRGRGGAFDARSHWGVEASVKYWHFVDVVWLIIYPTLYLVS